MKHKLLISFLIFALKINVLSQTMQIYGFDTKNYPYVKSNVYILDKDGKLVKDINKTDFKIKENGDNKIVNDFICPPISGKLPVSAILCLDISESMNHDNRLTNARNGIYQWINAMDSTKDETALTGFADIAILFSDFTNDSVKIRKSFDRIFVRSGTDFNEGFINPNYGCLEIAKNAKNRPIIIFITDGIGTGDESKILEKANSLDARVFTITIDTLPPPLILKNISEKTGGICFSNITDDLGLRNAFSIIKKNAESISPCSFNWLSSGCLSEKEVEFTYLPFGITSKLSFKGIDSMQAKFEIGPDRYIVFTPTTTEKIISITAKNAPIDIKNIKFSNNRFYFELIDSIPNFTLSRDSTFKLKIRANPSNDSSFTLCTVEIIGSTCVDNQFYCVSGNPGLTPRNGSIRIYRPNGGEEFLAKSKEKIVWNGTVPSKNSMIEYSYDGGQKWATIDSNAKGNSYDWNVPDVNSIECKVRITQFAKEFGRLLFSINTDSINVNSLAWSPEGSFILAGLRDSSFAVFNAIDGTLYWKMKAHQAQVKSVTWSPDGIRFATASEDSTIRIFNVLKKIEIDSIIGLGSQINSIAWSPKNDFLLSGGLDTVLYVFNVGDFSLFKKINLTNCIINQIKYSPQGKYIGIASVDSTVRIFDPFNYSLANKLSDNNLLSGETHRGPALSLAFNGNSTRVVTSGKENLIKVWNISRSKDSLENTFINKDSYSVNSVDWNPINNLISSTGLDGKVLVFKQDLSVLYTFNGSWNHNAVVFSPDGTRIASGYEGINIPDKIDVYSIDVFPLQRALSDNFFSIVKPNFTQKVITFGDVKVSSSNEITTNNFYVYNLKTPLKIDSIKIIDDINNSFDIVSERDFEIKNLKQNFTTFFFRPKVIGISKAKILSYTSIGNIKSDIVGNGIDLLLKPINYDFGEVVVNDTLEKNIPLLLNNSNTQIKIDGFSLTGPDITNFKILEKSSNFDLNSKDSKYLSIKFEPKKEERYLTSIKFQNQLDSTFSFISGIGVKPNINIINKLNFGDVYCNDSIIKQIKIANNGSGTLKITEVKLSSGSSDYYLLNIYKNINLLKGNDTTILLVFKPKLSGIRIGELTIISNAINSLKNETTVSLIGTKEEIDFTLIQSLLEFKSLLPGLAEVKNISIINNSLIPINWGNKFPISILSGRFQIESIIPNTTLPGKTSLVNIKFNGGTKGETIKTSFKFLDTCGNFKNLDLKAYIISDNPQIVSDDTIKFNDILCKSDSAQTNFEFSNNGGETLEIYNMFISGDDKDAFILDGRTKFQVIKGGNDFTRIKFIPQNAIQTRDYKAFLNIKTNDLKANKSDSILQIPLIIKKYEVGFSTSTTVVNFRFIGTLNPGTKYFEIKNTGTLALKWNKIPNLNLFNIVVTPPITPVGSSSTVSIDYIGTIPTSIVTNFLKLEDTCNHEVNILLKVIPADVAHASIKIGSASVKIGEEFSLPIYLQNSSNLAQTNLKSLKIELQMNSTLLYCRDVNLINKLESNLRTLEIPIVLQNLDDGLIYNLPLKSLWGNDSVSQVSISNISVLGNDVSSIEFDTLSGKVTVTDLCKNGGTRLFFRDKPISLNIFQINQDLNIEFNLIEDGFTDLSIFDLKGNKIRNIESKEMKIGEYNFNFNSKSLTQGKYFLVLKTSTKILSKPFNVIN
ncbi:MAG: choice-of-anchor D domain-containing protein [Candidatus Kapabacteria bacterium]|nr:choice-of-anchor D domain-containing protein [Candidatus Kapabacteria bacterium]